MKKGLLLSFLYAAVMVLCTSCFDIYEHISVDDDGDMTLYVQFTISKVIFEMLNSMSETPQRAALDYEDFLNEITADDSLGQVLRFANGSFGKINTEFYFGIFIKAALDRAKIPALKNTDIPPFIPQWKENGLVMQLYSPDGIISKETYDNEISPLFLSTACYRLSIAKTVINNMKYAGLLVDGNEVSLNFSDMYDMYLIEVPLTAFINKKCTLMLK